MRKALLVAITFLIVATTILGCAPGSPAPAASQPTAAPQAAAPTAPAKTEPTKAPAAPAAPAATAVPAAPAASTKDTLIIAQGADAFTMDPTQHTVLPTAAILFTMFEPLVFQTADGKTAPGLAESWKQEEPLRWRFNLRKGVKFTNGEPMNADAVAYSINRAIDPNTKSPYLSRINNITGAKVVDEYTVDLTTKVPDPILLYRLVQNSFASLIVPPKYTQEKGGKVPNDAPIGTGPYMFKEWVKDDHVTVVVNPNYWGGAPKIKTVTFKPIPETSARIAALKNGEVDIAVGIPPELVESINATGKTKAVEVPSDLIYFIAFNTETVEAFKKPEVRLALNYAVDVDAIIKGVMLGHGTRIVVPMTANGFGYPKDLKPYPYDPAKAKQMLADAGYPNGFGPVVFMSRKGRYLKDAELVEAVAGYLDKVGVKTTVQFVEAGVWGQLGDKHARGDMNFPGWSGFDPDLVWYAILRSSQYQSYFSNKQLDDLLDTGHSTMDQAQRADVYAQAAKLIYDQAPAIPLMQPPLIYGTNSNLVWQPSGDDLINVRGTYFK